MLEAIYEQTLNGHNASVLKEIEWKVLSYPMKHLQDGSLARANTMDTILKFKDEVLLKDDQDLKKLLVVSSQPFADTNTV